MSGAMRNDPTGPGDLLPVPPIRFLEDPDEPAGAVDPGLVIMTCANCGAAMDERKCKLICRCGYFLSCSDYY
jgi:hypothetical protein